MSLENTKERSREEKKQPAPVVDAKGDPIFSADYIDSGNLDSEQPHQRTQDQDHVASESKARCRPKKRGR